VENKLHWHHNTVLYTQVSHFYRALFIVFRVNDGECMHPNALS